jgi:hypothetical protein
MACLFGHKWSGCKCARCGKVRDEQHDWDLCKGKCKGCGKTQAEKHDWLKRDRYGTVKLCHCLKCGKVRDVPELANLFNDEKQHGLSYSRGLYTCEYCGKTNYRGKQRYEENRKAQIAQEEHLKQAQACLGHVWVSMVDHRCAYRCKLCGVEVEIHDYDNGRWKSGPSVYSDSTTDEWYEYKCRKCGEKTMGFEEARPINIHATNLRLGGVPGVENSRDYKFNIE